MGQHWYVILGNNEQRGPLAEDEVLQLIASGRVTGENYCWTEGLDQWAPLDQVAVFAAAFRHGRAQHDGSASETWTALKDTVGRGTREAVRTMKAARLKLRLAKLRKNREKVCAALGAEVYQQREDLELSDSMQAHVKSIADCDSEIAALEQAIAELDTEANQGRA